MFHEPAALLDHEARAGPALDLDVGQPQFAFLLVQPAKLLQVPKCASTPAGAREEFAEIRMCQGDLLPIATEAAAMRAVFSS